MKAFAHTAALAAAALVAACATPSNRTGAVRPKAELAAAPVAEPGASEVAAPRPATPEPATPDPVAAPLAQERTAEPSLIGPGFWSDPDFQRRFRDSYLAETPVEPPVTFEERELLEEVMALINTEQYAEALELLDEERTERSSAAFDQLRGNVLFLSDQLEESAVAYRVAVERYPKFLRAWKNLGIIHTQLGDHREAAEALTRVIELGGGDSLIYGALGAANLSLQNSIAAESAFRMAVLLDPDQLNWQLGLARAFFDQERFEEAASLCGTLIAENPDRADFWLLQANAYIGLEKPLRAAENYELVERLGASTESSMLLLGDIYTNQELFDLAIGAYARSFELADEPDPARPLRAVQLMIAREAYDLATELLGVVETTLGERLEREDEQELLELRARIAVAQGDAEEEARVLERLVSLDPTDGNALVLLGRYEQRTGNIERAELLFDRALELPEHEAEASLAKAQLLVQMQRYAEAVPLIQAAVAIDDRQAVRDYLQQVQRLAGRQ